MGRLRVERLRGEPAEFDADACGALPRRNQRRWGECCVRGLTPGRRRESIRPKAEQLPEGNTQAPQQFVNRSPRNPLPVRRRIAVVDVEVVPGPALHVVAQDVVQGTQHG
ncbi:hypothetical protein GCM10017557_82720 [Streptomyces aurantiacus]|uniref:Transposase IS701-like DDE domain-containing protein n=1 Tax=Streptomyces aurantiacus TaxID=47760 RepID=A0A7G1PCR1_9ACTN|nr:hypothetical protein GCM10017557_82720 [Streptomyces aurantiacus]